MKLPFFRWQDHSVGLKAGGTACPMLYMLVVAKNKAMPFISSIFLNCSDLITVDKVNENGFILSLPGNPSEKCIWNNKKSIFMKG